MKDYREIINLIEKYNSTEQPIICHNLRQLLIAYRAQEIANKLGVATQTVYGYSKLGYNKPPVEIALKICNITGISIDHLMTAPPDMPQYVDERPICVVEGCENRASAAKGMCWMHYRAELRSEQNRK